MSSNNVVNLVQPKNVVVTSITIKFPTECGWTKEILMSYVSRGGFLKIGSGVGTYDPVCFVPEFGSVINYDKMYEDGHIGKVLDKLLLWELTGMSDLDIIKRKG